MSKQNGVEACHLTVTLATMSSGLILSLLTEMIQDLLPKRILLSSLAACTGMDVVSLLEKMRASVDGFEMEIEADLTEEHPKVFSEIGSSIVFSERISRKTKIEKAIAMSQETYCGVSEMLRKNSPLLYSIEYINLG